MTLLTWVRGHVRRLALGLLLCAGVAGWGGPATAGEARVHYASLSAVGFSVPALSDQELSRQRGAGLDDEAAASSADGDSLAVILWDEWKPNGNGGGSLTSISYDNGFDSQVSSSITGQAY